MTRFNRAIYYILLFLSGALALDLRAGSALANTSDYRAMALDLLAKSDSQYPENMDSCLLLSHRAIEAALKSKNDSIIILAYRSIIFAYNEKPYAEDSAFIYVPLVEPLLEKNEFPLLSHSVNNVISDVYTQAHQYDQGAKFAQRAIESAKLAGNLERTCKSKIKLADVYRKAKYLDQAREIFTEVAQIADKEKFIGTLTDAYRGVGICYDLAKDYENAMKYFQKVVDLTTVNPDIKQHYSAYNNLGVAQWHLKKYPEAIVSVKKAAHIAETSGGGALGTNYKNLAAIYCEMGELDSSIHYGNLAMKWCKKQNERLLLKQVYEVMAETYEKKGDYKEALAQASMLNAIKDSLKLREHEVAMAEMEATYQNKEKQARIELLNKEKDIQSLRLHEKEAALMLADIDALQKADQIALLNKNKEIQELTLSNTRDKLKQKELETVAQKNELQLMQKDQQIKDNEIAKQTLIRNSLLIGTALILLLGFLMFNRFQLRKKIESQQALLDERKRISHELHDDLGAQLSTARIFLDNIKTNASSEGTQKLVQQSLELIDSSIKDLRKIMDDLQSSTLQQEGYIAATEELVNKINQLQKIDFKLTHSGIEKRLVQKAEHQLFRITQELINNSLKYANAKNVAIDLVKRNDQIVFLYEDDGIGFDPAKIKRGYGLNNIETRVQSLNGAMEIDTAPGKGMRAIVEIPLVYAG